MEPEEYAALQTAITAAVVVYVGQLGKFFVPGFLSPRDWIGFLELLWPAVKQARDESSILARTFYDQQRDKAYPTVPNLTQYLEPYEFQWFVEDMEPARPLMQREDAQPKALDVVQLAVARAVENGGRRQIIHAIERDEQLDEFVKERKPAAEKLATREPELTDANELTADSFDRMMDELEAKFNTQKPERKDAGDELVRGWLGLLLGAKHVLGV